MKNLILKWNDTWIYDFWWREKYGIAFNSSQHRSMSPMDIKFDYLEKKLAQKQQDELEEKREREVEYVKSGIWLRKNEDQTKKEEKILEQVSLSRLIGK